MIHNLLRHRCTVQRSTFTLGPEWERTYEWADLATDVPCLLDVIGQQRDVSEKETDRTAILYVLGHGTPMAAGDRIVMTLGGQGTWILDVNPKRVSDLRQPSHVEWPCSEVSAA